MELLNELVEFKSAFHKDVISITVEVNSKKYDFCLGQSDSFKLLESTVVDVTNAMISELKDELKEV